MRKNTIVLFYLDLQLLLELGIKSDRNYFNVNDCLIVDKSNEEVKNIIPILYETYKDTFNKSDILAFPMMEESSLAEMVHYLHANVTC